MRLGGGVDDATTLSVKSQVFRTDFAYSELFRQTNLAPEGLFFCKHLRRHFEVQFTALQQILARPGYLAQQTKIQLFWLKVTFLELDVPEPSETSESQVKRQALFAQSTMSRLSERARGLQSTHTIFFLTFKHSL